MNGRYKKFFKIILINSIILISLSSCASNKNMAILKDPTVEKLKIGIAVYDEEDEFVRSVCKHIEESAIREQNSTNNMEILIKKVGAGNNQEVQNTQIQSFINDKYDAIAVNIVDRSQASIIINKAKKADIPVVFFNREPVPEDMAIWDKVYYVGAKAQESGKMQAEIIINAINEGESIDLNGDGVIQYVMIEGEPGHQDAILRTYHSIKILEDNGYKTENIASDTGLWKKEEAKTKMKNWIETLGDQIEIVIANNDAMALGAVEALDESIYHKIKVIGVDGLEEAIEAIKKGKMLGTVLNDAKEQGEYIMAKMYTLALDKEPVELKNADYNNKCFHSEYKIIDKNMLNK